MSTKDNFISRFSSLNLLDTIKKNKDDYKSFINRIKTVDVDLFDLTKKVLETKYDVHRINSINHDVIIVKEKGGKKFGIFDMKTLDFYEKDGIKYDCDYQMNKPDSADDEHGNMYYVETFSKTFTMDNNSFYALYNLTNKRYSFICTFNRYNELIDQGKIIPHDDYKELKNINPDQDYDIKEIYE
jgi:hypothetical protein